MHPLVDKIKALDADRLTPLNALEMLHGWKQELTAEDEELTPLPAKSQDKKGAHQSGGDQGPNQPHRRAIAGIKNHETQ